KEPRTISEARYDTVPGMWEPGQALVSLNIPQLPHHVSINSFGFRGEEPSQRWKEKTKILFVGDSFTFGSFVDDADTLPAQTARLLDMNLYEVFNAGLGGSTINDQIHFLEKALIVNPDVVVLVYSENDLDDLYASPALYKQLEDNRKMKSGLLGTVYSAVKDTCLFNLVLRARALWRNRNTEGKKAKELDAQGVQQVRGRSLIEYRRNFDKFSNLVSAAGAQLIFVTFPSHHTLYDQDWPSTIGSVLKAVPAIDSLDLTPILKQQGLERNELYLLPYDGHPSAKAYALAASELAPLIQNVVAEAKMSP
ncbi:MAG: SGNH/GDSL hydrolase family protein, partial [Bdellovibrionales bacterium]|nr:SGNH/GDSL hydrolase family protein [Bdellovibrionales bacterium]